MKEIVKKYNKGDLTIVWKPAVCIHSTICWKKATGLPDVFNPMVKPWIRPEAASKEAIIEQIKKCPSGALSFYLNEPTESGDRAASQNLVEVSSNGPLIVYGDITVKDSEGRETKKNKATAFCRCGGSGNKPYCDGTHKKIAFIG